MVKPKIIKLELKVWGTEKNQTFKHNDVARCLDNLLNGFGTTTKVEFKVVG